MIPKLTLHSLSSPNKFKVYNMQNSFISLKLFSGLHSYFLLSPSSCCCSSIAVDSWSSGLVVETQGGEFLNQLVQSVFLLVDYVQVVGQCREQTFTPWHDHVSVRKRSISLGNDLWPKMFSVANSQITVYFCFFFFSRCFSHSTSRTSFTSSTANITYWYSLRISWTEKKHSTD